MFNSCYCLKMLHLPWKQSSLCRKRICNIYMYRPTDMGAAGLYMSRKQCICIRSLISQHAKRKRWQKCQKESWCTLPSKGLVAFSLESTGGGGLYSFDPNGFSEALRKVLLWWDQGINQMKRKMKVWHWPKNRDISVKNNQNCKRRSRVHHRKIVSLSTANVCICT